MATGPVRCQYCPRVYTLRGAHAEAGARAAGWMVGEGPTIGGEHVRRVICGVCLGRVAPEDDPVAGWDARCRTCDWSASEEEGYEDEPWTEKDARAWANDHQCEPCVDLINPETAQAVA